MHLKPGAKMREVVENDWEKEIKSRDATYFLWIAIPVKLGLVVIVFYAIISGRDVNSSAIKCFLSAAFIWWLIVTPMIYGLKRSLKVYACLAVICGVVVGLKEWLLY